MSFVRVRERRIKLGRARSPAHGEVEEGVGADRIVVVLIAVLRVGTLALGVAQSRDATGLTHPAAARTALLGLTAQSAAVFALAAWRLRCRALPILGNGVTIVETLAGVGGLLVLAYATPPSLRTTSTFWIEPYTVISTLVLAASMRRPALGTLGAVCLTATYLVSVFVIAPAGSTLSTAARATALTNAISYLPFFAIGAIGFAVLRSVVGQTDELRHLLSRLSEERARVTAAKDAYRVGHDIPKALLREVHRGWLSVNKLRALASKYRESLLSTLGDGPRPAVHLRDEIDAVVDVFTVATNLNVAFERFGEVPAGAPTVLIAEAVRELLNNASYHAHGAVVTITGRSSIEQVWIAVHDDGPGVDPARLAATWALKQNTLHLLEVAGGAYEICSGGSSAAGTTVSLTWPAVPDASRGKSPPGGEAIDASGSRDVTHELSPAHDLSRAEDNRP